jgi:hypothetical protein
LGLGEVYLADHRWVIVTIHDVRDYALRNNLDEVLPFFEMACRVAEQHLGTPERQDKPMSAQGIPVTDEVIRMVVDSLSGPTPIDDMPSDNLTRFWPAVPMRIH